MYSYALKTFTPPFVIESEIGKFDSTFQMHYKISVIRRESCFESTLIHLTERFNDKDVYLIGTSNQSTMLAQRTQKLIEEIKPDTVMVQTSN